MKVCIIGRGLTSLTLAKALVNQNIIVELFSDGPDYVHISIAALISTERILGALLWQKSEHAQAVCNSGRFFVKMGIFSQKSAAICPREANARARQPYVVTSRKAGKECK